MTSSSPSGSTGALSGRAEQGVEVAQGVDPSKAPASQPAPGNDQLLVKAVAVHAGDDETGVADHADVADLEDISNRCDRSGRDTCQVLVLTSCPYLGAQQAQGLGDQAVTEVAEDDVVAGAGEVRVEGERQFFTRESVDHPLRGPLPGTAERGKPELSIDAGRKDARLVGHIECGGDDPLDSVGGEIELVHRLLKALVAAGQALAEFALDLEHLGGGLAADTVDGVVIDGRAAPQHGVADLVGEHGTDRAEIVADLFNLVRDP